MDSSVDVFQHLDSFLNKLILELIITVVFPNPIATQFLILKLKGCLFSFFFCHFAHFGLELWILLGHSE